MLKNTQKVVVIDNLATNLPILDEYLQTQQPKSILGLPILNRGRCIGVLYIQNRSTSGVFTHERTAILNFLCTQAAISLENARLYQEVDTLAQALRQSLDVNTQELNKTQLRLQLALDSSNIGLWDWNLQTDEIQFDNQWRQLLGYDAEYEFENHASEWASHIHPEDLETANAYMTQHLEQQTPSYDNEHRIRCQDNSYKWIRAKGRVVEWDEDGNPLRFIGTFTDISDRKQTEEALIELSQQLQKAQEVAQLGHWSCDLSTRVISWSEKTFHLFGRSLEEGAPSFEEYIEQIHAEDRSLVIDRMTAAGQGVPQNFDHRIVQPDGTVRYINCRAELELQGKQVMRLFGVVMDITDRRVAELELEHFFSISIDLLCIADTGGHFRRLSKAWQDILGYSITELEGRLFLDFVHPDDMEATLAAIATLEQGETLLKFTNRYRTKSGNYRYIEWLSVPQGELVYAAARDITERVETQSKLEDLLNRTQLLNSLSQEIRQSLELNQIIQRAVDAIFDRADVDICTFVHYWEEEGHPYSETVYEKRGSTVESWLGVYDLLNYPSYHKALIGNELFIFNLQNLKEDYDRGIYEFCTSVGVNLYLMLPIQAGEQLACLELGRIDGSRSWQPGELELLGSLAMQIAIAMQQAHLYQTAQERTQELQTAYHDLKEAQVQLIQAEKMSSLGQLVAGIAHEINNPVSFIQGNLEPLADSVKGLLDVMAAYQETYPTPPTALSELMAEIDLPFITIDLPKILNSMKTGATRIRDIVQSLRTFSRLDEAEFKAVNLNENIDNTLIILQNQLNGRAGKPTIQVLKNYSSLPPYECYIGLLNQVFMNLLINAIQAIEERQDTENSETYQGTITLTTILEDSGDIQILIEDNGIGMSTQVKAKILEPFFSTKPIGSGTGMGLPLAHQIITKYHQGQLSYDSVVGIGTTFTIRLPCLRAAT